MQQNFIFIIASLFVVNVSHAQTYKYDHNHQITETTYSNGTIIKFQYDANGNRIKTTFLASDICPGGTASFYADQSGTTFQWQVDTGTGFINIIDDSTYSGAATRSLLLINAPTSWYGYKYRCVIDGGTIYSNQETLKFVSTWFGGKDTAWENPANWGCNRLPDGNTDVIINGNGLYFPVVNSNVSVRSLLTNKKSEIKISDGFQLNVLH